MNGWRTIVIKDKAEISVKDKQLVAGGKSETIIPLEQIRQIMIESAFSQINVSAINAAIQENIHIMLCNERHTPVSEIIPIVHHHEAAGAIIDQTEWKQGQKNRIWKEIVELKLRNQYALLKQVHKEPSQKFAEYIKHVQAGDKTNREGIAARMYFSSLFGKDFRRHATDETNAKLNYGYTIMNSAFTRIIALHGYHTGLGIHHRSRDNPVNLSCDLMEPFRPFVDLIVYEGAEQVLDWEMKKRFIAIPSDYCRLDGKRMMIDTAIDLFTLETLKALKNGKKSIPEVSFE